MKSHEFSQRKFQSLVLVFPRLTAQGLVLDSDSDLLKERARFRQKVEYFQESHKFIKWIRFHRLKPTHTLTILQYKRFKPSYLRQKVETELETSVCEGAIILGAVFSGFRMIFDGTEEPGFNFSMRFDEILQRHKILKLARIHEQK